MQCTSTKPFLSDVRNISIHCKNIIRQHDYFFECTQKTHVNNNFSIWILYVNHWWSLQWFLFSKYSSQWKQFNGISIKSITSPFNVCSYWNTVQNILKIVCNRATFVVYPHMNIWALPSWRLLETKAKPVCKYFWNRKAKSIL